MKLYDAGLTFLLITALIFAFSGALGRSLWNGSKAICHESNVMLLSEGKQGPLRPC